MKLANQICLDLMPFINGNGTHLFLPNYYLQGYECDVCLVTKSGMITEYEIKISRGDFFADFEKRWSRLQPTKHEELQQGKLGRNYFYFIVPKDLVRLSEIPDHCGLIYYESTLGFPRFSFAKKAPMLTKEKFFSSYDNIWRLNQTLVNKVTRYQFQLRYQRLNKKNT